MRRSWILCTCVYISTLATSHSQLPFEITTEDLGNAEADFIDFFLSNPDMLFNALDVGNETTTVTPTTNKPAPEETSSPAITVDSGTEQFQNKTDQTDHGTEHTSGNRDLDHGLVVENGMVRDPVSGAITHVLDIHDGELLEVIQSEITGGHIIDPHTGELILLSELPTLTQTTLAPAPQTTTVTILSVDTTTENHNTDPSGNNHQDQTGQNEGNSQNKVINGVIRDPDTNEITHIVDPHTGEHLEVIQSPIFGAHVFDSHTGELIIAEDHALEHGTVDVQSLTSGTSSQPITQPPAQDTTTVTTTTTEAVTSTTTKAETQEVVTTTKSVPTETIPPTTPTITSRGTTEGTTTITETVPTKTTSKPTTTMTITTEAIGTAKSVDILDRITTLSNEEISTTTQTPVEISTNIAEQVTTQTTPNVNKNLAIGHIYENQYVVPSSNKTSTTKPNKTQRRKFGTKKGIYSVLEKYRSEYLKNRKNRQSKYGEDLKAPNINKVLKWIEKRKDQFKKVLQDKKEIEEVKKINPKERFHVVDLENYFPSLQRNKFGGLEARKKWRARATPAPISVSAKGNSENRNTQNLVSISNNGNKNVWENAATFRNPHSKKGRGRISSFQQNPDRTSAFWQQMSTKLNPKQFRVNDKIQKVPTTRAPIIKDSTTPKTIEITTESMTVRRKNRRKFANKWRKTFSRQQNKQKPEENHESTQNTGSMGNYWKSLKEKVYKNTADIDKQTSESYVADLARKINNKRIARDPENIKKRKKKWQKSYLAEQNGN
ncbi:mucin-3B-like [Saccostrea cucullata]|uniref:mucin-3B-like n=1 Tax=Saccostrea cuccullata TaxID=36930 RepID=UPI002ED2CA5F